MFDEYVNLIRSGQPVAFPTETVYGLGADAWNPSAIKKVFTTKGRPSDNPLIVHIASRNMVAEFAESIPSEAEVLMDTFWPGPLTLIFRKKAEVLDFITAGLPTVALRWPDHPVAQKFIAKTGPLVAPSANSSGRPSPTKPEHVREDFGTDFPVLEAGETQIGLESTVLDVSEEPFRIYRPGHVGKSDIEKVLNKEVQLVSSVDKNSATKSPGMKYTHYAPKAEVQWLKGRQLTDTTSLYLLHRTQPVRASSAPNIICYDGNYQRMAQELYDRFREADHTGYRNVVIESFDGMLPDLPPIAAALVNRITKAIGS